MTVFSQLFVIMHVLHVTETLCINTVGFDSRITELRKFHRLSDHQLRRNHVRAGSGVHPAYYLMSSQVLFSGTKRPESETNFHQARDKR